MSPTKFWHRQRSLYSFFHRGYVLLSQSAVTSFGVNVGVPIAQPCDEGVGIAFGGGWGDYSGETDADVEQWNVGLDLDFVGFGLGAAYLDTEADGGAVNSAGFTVADEETIVVGADYQLGAYKLGASWLNQDEADLERYTGGVSYAYGPGMSFRGSVSYIDADTDTDSTQVLLGTQVNF